MGISRIMLNGTKRAKQEAREVLARNGSFDAAERIAEQWPRIFSDGATFTEMRNMTVRALDRKIKQGANLSLEEAFVGMCSVLAATNILFYEEMKGAMGQAYGTEFSPERALAVGTAFLQLLAAKEAFRGLTPEEIAGIAAAGMMDVVVRVSLPSVIETCGMGGDVGFHGGTLKTINTSTLSAFVLAALGLPVVKHGSYSNTSAIGSTEAIERFGGKTVLHSLEEIEEERIRCNFCYLDAHLCKTIHDLSHLIMMETVNHVVGPMSLPVHPDTVVHKVMGVNEKVHPSLVARAYAILHERGIQKCGGIVIVGGLSEGSESIDPGDENAFRERCTVDELSPFASVVSVSRANRFLGNDLLTPADFGVVFDPEAIMIPNTAEDIHAANIRALQGTDETLADYLAMNAALGVFAVRHLGNNNAVRNGILNRGCLRRCFKECRAAISSGAAWEVLERFSEVGMPVRVPIS